MDIIIVGAGKVGAKLVEDLYDAVSYTHLDVYKRQVWRC